jgi:hypothetical protein
MSHPWLGTAVPCQCGSESAGPGGAHITGRLTPSHRAVPPPLVIVTLPCHSDAARALRLLRLSESKPCPATWQSGVQAQARESSSTGKPPSGWPRCAAARRSLLRSSGQDSE